LNIANDFTFNIKGLGEANGCKAREAVPNRVGSLDLAGATVATLASGEYGLEPAHAVPAEVYVELPTLTGGHAEVVVVTDANLNTVTGVKVVVGHHVSGSFAGYTVIVRTKSGRTRGQRSFI
jgi:hypothetical protein